MAIASESTRQELPIILIRGFGGLDARAALFWAFVGIPLAWGVWKTLESAVKIL